MICCRKVTDILGETSSPGSEEPEVDEPGTWFKNERLKRSSAVEMLKTARPDKGNCSSTVGEVSG
jgi:hypothetical protein